MRNTQRGGELENLGLAFSRGEADLKQAYDAHGALIYPICRKALGESNAAEVTAVLVVATSGALVVARGGGDDEELVSTAVLVHDPVEFDARGVESSTTAHLVGRDGHFEIELTDADLPTVTGDDLELWLIEPDAAGTPVDVKPVAVIEGSAPITYRVPEELDPRSLYVVDISIEPRDGNTARSGQSILHGPFERS